MFLKTTTEEWKEGDRTRRSGRSPDESRTKVFDAPTETEEQKWFIQETNEGGTPRKRGKSWKRI